MEREIGDKTFIIWLLGDSEPINWREVLDSPLDPRHPIRHNIWTSILEVLQDTIYRYNGKRLETNNLYIRNAIDDPSLKPKSSEGKWSEILGDEVKKYGDLIATYHPNIILTFGAFSYEFARRAIKIKKEHSYGFWGAKTLGEEFRNAINTFKPQDINLIPLLHRSISGGRFIQSHRAFCEGDLNYFKYTGDLLASLLVKHYSEKNIWVKIS